MIKRIEFKLNLNDPQEAALYRALTPALSYRRAGAIIRQALTEYYAERVSVVQPTKEQSHAPQK